MNYEDVIAKCPFYLEKQDDPSAVKCEGTNKGNIIKVVCRGSKIKHVKRYCAGKYNDCIICKALMDKYEKGER